MIQLRQYASTAWPDDKIHVPDNLRCCWNHRDEVYVQDELVFRNNKIVIPAAKREEVLRLLHATHGAAEKMKAQARNAMYWPGMSADIEAVAKSCSVCQKYSNINSKLPTLSHVVPNLPWQIVGIDLFYQSGREFLILVDFYSFYFEIKAETVYSLSCYGSLCRSLRYPWATTKNLH